MSRRLIVLLAASVIGALCLVVCGGTSTRALGPCPHGKVGVLNPTMGEVTCVAIKPRSKGQDGQGSRDEQRSRSGSHDADYRRPDPEVVRRGEVKESVEFMCRELGICHADDAWKGSQCSMDPDAPYGTGRGLPGERCPTHVQPDGRADSGGGDGPPPISPRQAAQQVIAKLKFNAAHPQVGPNRDHHNYPFDTAVGYPVWLWTVGGTRSDSVSETVGSLAVSISVKLDKVIWDLGDGTVLRCDEGLKWRRGTAPGKKSPTCGHAYQTPGKYSIRATSHWTITWTAGGESGTLPYSITADRAFEVGEIHVLVR